MTRHRAIIFVASFGFLLGLPSALSLNFHYNQDWAWGLGLIVSGMFIAFAAIKYGVERVRTKLINTEGNDLNAGKWFNYIVMFLIPIEFVILIVWWSWQAITTYDPDGWWNPFRTYSLGTCVFQWGLAIIIFIVINKWLYRRSVESGA